MKYRNEVIVGISLVLALLSMSTNFLVVKQLERYPVDITGEAISSGQSRLCINYAPEIDISNCSSSYVINIIDGVQVSGNYSCAVAITDSESTPTSWINTSFFNLTNGTIRFIPTRDLIGTHVIPFYADDGYNCSNSFINRNLSLSITYNNSAPYFHPSYPDPGKSLVLQQYYTTFGMPLTNFFTDANGDPLSFSITYIDSHCFNIRAQVDNITKAPRFDPGSYYTRSEGPCRAYLQAWDDWGGRNISNIFNITVEPTIIPEPEQNKQAAGGGGGGGAPPPQITCVLENVTCTEWTRCMYNPPPWNLSYEGPENGIQTRECSWYTNCPGELKPAMRMICDYVPTCDDGIQNQGEEGIDCGGPCPPCPTCDDGIQNQGEEGIDCGGPCPPCMTCFDGIQNQGEEGIDCGGPCPPCPTCDDGIRNQGEEGIDCGGPCPPCIHLEAPALVGSVWINILLIAIVSGLLLLTGYHYRGALIATGHALAPSSLILPFIAFKNKIADRYRSMIGAVKKKKQEKTDDLINQVLLPFDVALQDLSGDLPKIQNSSLRKIGEDLIVARRANAFSLLGKQPYVYAFGTKTTINFTISIRDLPLIKEILVHLKEVRPIYGIAAKMSTYLFKEDMQKKAALEYSEKESLTLGSDRQVMVTFLPRTQSEEKTIITTIKDIVLSVPKGQLVWRYNNVHVYRTHRGDDDFQGELGFNVKETKNHVLLVSSRKKIKDFERFSVEVVTW